MNIYDDKPKRVDMDQQDKYIEVETENVYETITHQIQTQVDLRDSVVFLTDEITEGTLVDLMIRIRAILNNRTEEDKDNPINLVINSSGGDVYEMLGIIDYIETLSVPVNTICRGRAFSAAAVILACGTGVRMVSKRSCVMFHESSSYLDGIKMSDMSAYINNLNKIEDDVCELLAKRSNKDATWWKQQQRIDMFLSAEQLLEYGIIDEII
jgi:ATP-dependent Clp protease, protease subunit